MWKLTWSTCSSFLHGFLQKVTILGSYSNISIKMLQVHRLISYMTYLFKCPQATSNNVQNYCVCFFANKFYLGVLPRILQIDLWNLSICRQNWIYVEKYILLQYNSRIFFKSTGQAEYNKHIISQSKEWRDIFLSPLFGQHSKK